MNQFNRIDNNPIIEANKEHDWEAQAAFNPCVIKDNNKYHLLYRALSSPTRRNGTVQSISSIGYAESDDGVNFTRRRQLIMPDQEWDKFGCEDPRVTKLGDKYYIFYTALSGYPFSQDVIRIGLAITKDFKTIDEKYSITSFNSKAMALFPDKINDQWAAILTVNTDMPPAKIALILCSQEKHLWSPQHWAEWYSSLDSHVIPLLRSSNDHLEVGAPPIKTKEGWLLIYSYISNYFSGPRTFGIEAVLLDLANPLKVIGRTAQPLMVPEKKYELYGDVPNIIFPSGAILDKTKLSVYYGAADSTCCLAVGDVEPLLDNLTKKEEDNFIISKGCPEGMLRYSHNPIITPRPEFAWEAKATFNPAIIYEAGKVHIVYRAMGYDNTSVFGYASSADGVHIDERLPYPIYEPRETFERKLRPGNSGCEDPRISKIGDRLYLFYTAFDTYMPSVAFSSIKVTDFINHQWNWESPKVISPEGIPDKDACLLPKKVDEKYLIFHRIAGSICINFLDDLLFKSNHALTQGLYFLKPTSGNLHILKVGMAGPPIETPYGWLLIYHWITDEPVKTYEIGAALLSLDDSAQMISPCCVTLLKPELDYEIHGQVDNVVFSCGATLLDDCLFLYYGAADTVVAVAKIELKIIFEKLKVNAHAKSKAK